VIYGTAPAPDTSGTPVEGGKKSGTTLPPPTPGKGKKGGKAEKDDDEPTTQAPTTGTILVNLPAAARLTVDGRPTTSTTATRMLVTPELQPGYEYYYTLRAEIMRDGRAVAQTQRVAVHRGERARVSFDFASGGVASSR
jgi:uncharacterized protein (TIGR03000 family)